MPVKYGDKVHLPRPTSVPVISGVLTLYLLVSSADNFCKQLGSRSGNPKHRDWSGSKQFDTLMAFLKEFFKKCDFEKIRRRQKSHEKLLSMQSVKTLCLTIDLAWVNADKPEWFRRCRNFNPFTAQRIDSRRQYSKNCDVWKLFIKSWDTYRICAKPPLTLKAPRKKSSENVVVWSRLLQIIANHYWRNKYRSKQRGPRSSLIWVHTVCHRGFLNISADEKADDFCCDWRIKG